MPKAINWSSVKFSELQQIEKSMSADSKFQYKINYLGHSVTIESVNNLEKSEIQKLALQQLSKKHSEKLEIESKQHQDAPKKIIPLSTPKLPGIQQLVKMAAPLRDLVLKNLKYNDIVALDDALQKYLKIGEDLETSFVVLKKQVNTRIKISFFEDCINEILQDHSKWKTTVNGWQNVTLEDKLWLLRLYELRNIGIEIPQIVSLEGFEFIPLQSTPEFLEPDIKTAIRDALNVVTTLQILFFQKCPQSICLLENLQKLVLNDTSLTTSPNVSKNIILQVLALSNNKFTAPPNVSMNVNLLELDLNHNQLTTPPDVSRNVHLQVLSLNYNWLKTSPNLSTNVNLLRLELNNNQLTTPPDVSRNVHLQVLALGRNNLTTPPDVSKNINLTLLRLSDNQLTTFPDVSMNVNLLELYLDSNQLTTPPDVSKNVKLQRLTLHRNQLETPPDVSRNVNLEFLFLNVNKLTTPPDVSKNVKLVQLSLKKNQLRSPPDVDNINLQELELTDNQITTLPKISKTVQILELKGNPLTIEAKQALVKLLSERELQFGLKKLHVSVD